MSTLKTITTTKTSKKTPPTKNSSTFQNLEIDNQLGTYRHYVTRKVFMRWWGMNYGAATKSSGHREDYVSGIKTNVHSCPLKDDKGTNKIQVRNISDFMVTSDSLSSTFLAVHFCQPQIYPLSLKP